MVLCATVLGVLSSTSKVEEATEIADAVLPLCEALQIRNMDGASRAPVENDIKEFLTDATTGKTSFGSNDFLPKAASCQIEEMAEEMVDTVGLQQVKDELCVRFLEILQRPVALMIKDV